MYYALSWCDNMAPIIIINVTLWLEMFITGMLCMYGEQGYLRKLPSTQLFCETKTGLEIIEYKNQTGDTSLV